MIRQLTYHPDFPRKSVAIRQQLLRFTLSLVLGFTTLFFTNMTVVYYRNFYQIRENGQSMAMIVQRTERTVVGKGTQKSRAKTYRYQAVFQFRNQERTVPVSKKQYEHLKPGDPVLVLYGAKQDGFISENDPADHRQLITPLLFWAVFAGSVGKTWRLGRNRLTGKQPGDRLHRTAGYFAGTT
ncbi:hypothetical protein [Larkinella humicola]|uniref:DUF3592 domain-containing protein n=1 Tax=Larkinella humicola TaxID=2607654 RepID=A0A5N1J6Q0_9BACT|nr:hypothetical protein [Larkinella humicola]KAA9346402.1 hypothetical protein F0P93_27855 [Larkinella humicola]